MLLKHKIKLNEPTQSGWILNQRCAEILMGQSIGKYLYNSIGIDEVKSMSISIDKILGVVTEADIIDDVLTLVIKVNANSELGSYLDYWQKRNREGDTSGGSVVVTTQIIANLDENNVVQEEDLVLVGLQLLSKL